MYKKKKTISRIKTPHVLRDNIKKMKAVVVRDFTD